jgi:hypothetical protein
MFLESHWQFLYECFFYTFFSKTVQKTLEKKRASRGGGEVGEFDESDAEPMYSDGDDDITADERPAGPNTRAVTARQKRASQATTPSPEEPSDARKKRVDNYVDLVSSSDEVEILPPSLSPTTSSSSSSSSSTSDGQ